MNDNTFPFSLVRIEKIVGKIILYSGSFAYLMPFFVSLNGEINGKVEQESSELLLAGRLDQLVVQLIDSSHIFLLY